MKKFLALVLCLVVSMSIVACGSQSATPPASSSSEPSSVDSSANDWAPTSPVTVHFGTSASGTTNHTIASGMANMMMDKFSDYDVIADVSTGSQENIRSLYNGNMQMAFAMLDVVKYGYEGGREFSEDDAPEDPFRYVVGSSPTMITLITREDSDFETIADLKGAKWGTGIGAASQYYTPIILEAHGMTIDDIEQTPMALADICNGLTDGIIDVGVWITPGGSAAIVEVAQTTGIRLIPIEEEIANNIIAEHPYFSYVEISQDTYPGLETSTMALATSNVILARTDLDEDFVYNFTKMVCENTEELILVNAKSADYCVDNVMRAAGNIPFHPGAERYYKEIGLID